MASMTDVTDVGAGVACDKWGVVLDRPRDGRDGARRACSPAATTSNGADLVVTAIRDGRIAAEAMLAYLAALDVRTEIAASA